MSAILLLAAELEPKDPVILLKNMAHSGWSQMSIILGSIAVVTALSFLTVYCFRKRILRHYRRRHHRHRATPKATAAAQNPGAEENSGRVRKKWRRSRSRRPLNPTLEQTRGLPPLRGEETPPR